MPLPISPLAPKNTPDLPPIAGCRMAAVASGIRKSGALDLLLMAFEEGTQVAGVFTQSKTSAAPVLRSKQHAAGGQARALIVNSGNANAFTGQLGEMAVNQTLATASGLLGCEQEECFVASTGVIGEPLPYENIIGNLPDAHSALSHEGWGDAAKAICTTDTFQKLATRSFKIGSETVTLNGIAKGSGMIAPDMATMLGFIATDAKIEAEALQELLRDGTETSFNAITVDSDTSTSDMVLLFATGQGAEVKGDELALFRAELHSLMLELAKLIVRDGEGAKKFFTVKVTGAANDVDAKIIAMAIANSPLVKTAIAGEDANWGRVVMAVGKSGAAADRDTLKISFGEHLLTQKGQRHSTYDEAIMSEYMKQPELTISVDIGLGEGQFTAYSCDLTNGYIAINADYRT
ncbi:MAG: bifunctional glutamate N-acetyltransferase/amino-acid acetyltransferase ArgJ [Rickettsiales bacterium]|nr:bifunctional glutamate N-acetyltransferase/amino-acid acetyltransferase ArgJ [Rickettsiales bacterium]